MTGGHKSYYGGASLWFRIFTCSPEYQLSAQNNIQVVADCLLYISVVAKPAGPAHFRLAMEPGSLPASILSRRSLRSLKALLQGEFPPKALNRLFVSN